MERGKLVLEIARKSLHEIIENNNEWDPDLTDSKYSSLLNDQGAFTTIYSFKGDVKKKTLRGCVGFPYPTKPLAHAISCSARNAATKDPRFSKIDSSELSKIKINVEILSPVEEIIAASSTEFLDSFDIGTHGLIVKKGNSSGLLLSKVPVEYGWDKILFIDHLFQKAWLPFSSIDFIVKDPEIKIYKFTSEIHSELS